MAMGQAVASAATLALEKGVRVRDVEATDIQQRMRQHNADPGDIPSANATIDAEEEEMVAV
jgi:hypothetical protein